jgi:hypothetical protein
MCRHALGCATPASPIPGRFANANRPSNAGGAPLAPNTGLHAVAQVLVRRLEPADGYRRCFLAGRGSPAPLPFLPCSLRSRALRLRSLRVPAKVAPGPPAVSSNSFLFASATLRTWQTASANIHYNSRYVFSSSIISFPREIPLS